MESCGGQERGVGQEGCWAGVCQESAGGEGGREGGECQAVDEGREVCLVDTGAEGCQAWWRQLLAVCAALALCLLTNDTTPLRLCCCHASPPTPTPARILQTNKHVPMPPHVSRQDSKTVPRKSVSHLAARQVVQDLAEPCCHLGCNRRWRRPGRRLQGRTSCMVWLVEHGVLGVRQLP